MIYTAQLSFVLLDSNHAPVASGAVTDAGAEQERCWACSSASSRSSLCCSRTCAGGGAGAAAACLAAVFLAFAVGIAVFGWHNHVSWIQRLAVAESWAWLPMNASLMGMVTRLFTESIWYVPLASLSADTLRLLWLGIGGTLGLARWPRRAATIQAEAWTWISHCC